MRYSILVLITLTAMVTQSCRITTPSLLEVFRDIHEREKTVYDFDMSKALAARTQFRDTLVIGDDPESLHGKAMEGVIARMGIPEGSLVFFERLGFKGGWRRPRNVGLPEFVLQEQLHKATRVAHVPKLLPLVSFEDLPMIQELNTLFVLGAANMFSGGEPLFNGDRDLYNINHTRWSHEDSYRDQVRKESYRALLEIRATGKVISATSAKVTESGEIEPNERVVRCGDIKTTCFTLVPSQTTSRASARPAAMSFYLAQFWETPEEIVEVLGSCAMDVGEPGVDREYGRGVANLLCPPVLKKEIEVVSAYLGGAEEKVFTSAGGDLKGAWQADNTTLQAHLPAALKETLEAEHVGAVNGTIEFEESKVKGDFTAQAEVSLVFLLADRIRAKAEDAVQVEGAYIATKDTLRMPGEALSYTYTATEDSLHLIKSLTLHEALALLPDPLGSMTDLASPDFFESIPIQIRMSFAKAKPVLIGDFDRDGTVGIPDFLIFVNAFGSSQGDAVFDEKLDLVPDGFIGIADFLIFIDQFGKTYDS